MEKTKIAESIIIKVGGGIREVFREPLKSHDAMEPAPNESGAEKSDGPKTHHAELEPSTHLS